MFASSSFHAPRRILISQGTGIADWQNADPDEVETEWELLQVSAGGGGANDGLQGASMTWVMDRKW